jgi:thymidylate synthase
MLKSKSFVPDKTGQKTIEILGAQFVADDNTIFGAPNANYIRREIGWYMSRSLNINDMESPIPQIWQSVASDEGFVNSNYGYLLFDPKNESQLDNCIVELKQNPYSRRAVAIYTRPSIWKEYNYHGMSDFICTNTVQYFLRQSPNEIDILRLFARVDMRSNDAWAGYRNDFAWQFYILNYMHSKLKDSFPKLKRGAIIWCCGSLHIYERNFDLVQHYIDTGDYAPHLEKLMVTRRRMVQEGVLKE